MVQYMFRADEIVRQHLGYEMIITSCRDSKHSETSRHYIGCAWDFRTWTTIGSGNQISDIKKQALVDALSEAIPEIFFLAESNHIHCGFKIRYGDT
jgi:hypothetical protein